MSELKGKRILITRDASQAGSLEERLTALGAEVICVPTITITDPPDWTPFDAAAERLPDYDWVVFSSVNAVERTAKRLSFLDIPLDLLQHLQKAAVGDQTARAIETVGWAVDLVPDRYQAEDLLAAMLARGVGGCRIWVPRALEARPVLIDSLRGAGAEVMVSPVYQNKIPLDNRDRLRHVLVEDRIDWITFTSSSTVSNFFSILGENPRQEELPQLASIGRITTKTLAAHGLMPAFTAKPQNLEGLCQGILDVEQRVSDTL